MIFCLESRLSNASKENQPYAHVATNHVPLVHYRILNYQEHKIAVKQKHINNCNAYLLTTPEF